MHKNSFILILMAIVVFLSLTIVISLLTINFTEKTPQTKPTNQEIILKKDPVINEQITPDPATKTLVIKEDIQENLASTKKESDTTKRESSSKNSKNTNTRNSDPNDQAQTIVALQKSNEKSSIDMLNVLRNCERKKSELPPPTIPI